MSDYTITQEEIDETVETLARFADLYDDGVDVRTDYSGRGMFGRSCVGFVVADHDLPVVTVALFQTLAKRDGEGTAWEIIAGSRTDSMGRSTIVYWPELTLEGDDDDEEDTDPLDPDVRAADNYGVSGVED